VSQHAVPGGSADPPGPSDRVNLQVGGKPMSPMEEMGYFDIPRVTYPVVGAGTSKQILGKDPRRVALIIHSNGAQATNNVFVSPDSTWSNQSSIPANGGFLIGVPLPYILLTQASVGIVVQWEWFCNNTEANPVTLTVIESLLKQWPG
jgi:hypothetical protein